VSADSPVGQMAAPGRAFGVEKTGSEFGSNMVRQFIVRDRRPLAHWPLGHYSGAVQAPAITSAQIYTAK